MPPNDDEDSAAAEAAEPPLIRRFRRGHDIFCTGRRVNPRQGGQVNDLISRCLHRKVMNPALLHPTTKEGYEAAVDVAACELFRAICLEDGRKFVQTSRPNQPTLMRTRDAVDVLRVELMEARNVLRARMRRTAAAEGRDGAVHAHVIDPLD